MTDIILMVGVAVFTVFAAFHIAYILSVRSTARRLDAFLRDAEGRLHAALDGLTDALANAERVSSDVRSVTADVRELSGTLVAIEREVRDLYQGARETVGAAAEANLAGLKAGIRTGVATLVRNMQKEGSDDHERGTDR